MSRYKKLVNEMLEKNKDLFDKFREIHDKFEKDSSKYRKEFNKVGEEVVEVIRVYVDDLCRTSESSGYGNYTSKLAEKFWDEMRKEFVMIDEVGIE